MTSVTDDIHDWPFPNKILGCAMLFSDKRKIVCNEFDLSKRSLQFKT